MGANASAATNLFQPRMIDNVRWEQLGSSQATRCSPSKNRNGGPPPYGMPSQAESAFSRHDFDNDMQNVNPPLPRTALPQKDQLESACRSTKQGPSPIFSKVPRNMWTCVMSCHGCNICCNIQGEASMRYVRWYSYNSSKSVGMLERSAVSSMVAWQHTDNKSKIIWWKSMKAIWYLQWQNDRD